MDETADAGGAGGGDHRFGAGDIAGGKAGAIGRVDDAGDVDDGARTFAQAREGGGIVERAGNPCDVRFWRLGAAGERPRRLAAFTGDPQHMAADEAGAAGDRDGVHSRTI